MITKKQLKIFEAFAKNPLVELTRKQVKKESKEKSNNALAMAIQQMKKEEVLLERKIGRTGLLALNLDSEAAMDYLALCNNQRLGRELQAAIRMIKGKIDLVTPFYSLVVFGSHASGESNKSSDIDLAVFIEGDERRKRIEAAIGSAKLKTTAAVDEQVIPKGEMMEMLASDEENLGKQIARKHMAIHNPSIFYGLIKEGMRHGFRA